MHYAHWAPWRAWLILVLMLSMRGSTFRGALAHDQERVAVLQAVSKADGFYGDAIAMYIETIPPERCAPATLIEHLYGIPPSLATAWCAPRVSKRHHDPAVIEAVGLRVTDEIEDALVASDVFFDETHTHALVKLSRGFDTFRAQSYFWVIKQQGRWHVKRVWLAAIT